MIEVSPPEKRWDYFRKFADYECGVRLPENVITIDELDKYCSNQVIPWVGGIRTILFLYEASIAIPARTSREMYTSTLLHGSSVRYNNACPNCGQDVEWLQVREYATLNTFILCLCTYE